jgi:hypothetical protein
VRAVSLVYQSYLRWFLTLVLRKYSNSCNVLSLVWPKSGSSADFIFRTWR